MYESLTAQTLHYFARPHERVRTEPLDVPAAWRGEEMAERTDWRVELGEAQVREIWAAVRAARRTGKPNARMTAEDFPLPTLRPEIARWRRQITSGRGFVLVRGVPVGDWPRADAELFFWCLGQHLGKPGAQNPQGDLLGHVVDTGEDAAARTVRRYRTSADIAYHCDAADAVGLLCLERAESGGLSRIVSSVAVYNELLRTRPDLVDRLYEPFLLDAHGEGGIDHFPIEPCRYAGGRLRTFYHSDYFRSVQSYHDVPPLSPRDRELLDTYEAIATSPGFYLDMDLAPGDIQLLSNHVVLHARTAYRDRPAPERRRHLLRLWLSLEEPGSLHERALVLRSRARLIAWLLRMRLRRLVRGPARHASEGVGAG